MPQCSNCPHAASYAFCSIRQQSRVFLEENSMSMEYPRGNVLFREGERCHSLFILCSGRAKVSMTSREGRTMILRIAKAGDTLGMSAAMSHTNYEATVEALEPCHVRVMPLRFLDEMLREHTDSCMGAARTLAADYHSALDEARRIALPGSPAGRLARLILDWADDARQKSPLVSITMSLTHDELASLTATTRETVTRTLSRFRKENIIATRGVSLTILQPEMLEEISAC